MKVLQINAVYGHGSTGVITKAIRQCCLDNGIDAYVAFPKGQGVPNDHTYEIGRTWDHKIHAFLSRVFGKQAYFSHCPTKGLLRFIDELQPDIVHLHNLHSNYVHLNMLLRYLAEKDIVTVITMHDCWYFTGGCMHYASVDCQRWQTGCGHCSVWKSLPSYFFDSTASVLKDREKYLNAIPRLTIVGASEWIANEARKSVLKEKYICYIHNGFDLSVFKPTPSDRRKQLGIDDRFVILGPANKWLLPVNKPTLDYFIENMTDDMVLVLFGNPNKNESLPKQVIQLGYTSSRQEMAELYSMADVFVNCSREDTLSSLNLESQACGTPVVTYDATGSRETVDDKCSFAVATGNAKELWQIVLGVKNMGKETFSSQCVELASSHFEMMRNYKRYIELYNKITKEKCQQRIGFF